VSVIEITSSYERLLAQQRALGPEARSAVELICAEEPALRRAVLRLLEIDASAVSPTVVGGRGDAR
jgi:hypothetical protein